MHKLKLGFFGSIICVLLNISILNAYADTKPDFKKYAAGPERKKVFINYVRPLIDKASVGIKEDRDFVLNLRNDLALSKTPSELDKKKLSELIKYYKVKETLSISEQFDELIHKANVYPVSLILAQAILESAWGTSRFAVEGNNFFGQHCFSKGCGIKARGDKRVEVAKFASVFDSIQSYYRNLNTGNSYKELRRLRAEEVSKVMTMDSIELTEGLSHYSELTNGDYERRLNQVITFNKLQQYDT